MYAGMKFTITAKPRLMNTKDDMKLVAKYNIAMPSFTDSISGQVSYSAVHSTVRQGLVNH